MIKQNVIRDCLGVLHTIVRDSQELKEFGAKYHGKSAKIIMVSPYVLNDSMVLYRSRKNDFKQDEDFTVLVKMISSKMKI